jgi:hypothetical protein
MGQEDEEAAELIATIRGEHVAMKTWYSGSSPTVEALRTKFGPYPSLWKEVLNWAGWKEVRKAYLQFTQLGEAPAPSDSSAPRKRRSRWGAASDAAQENAGNGHGHEIESSNKRRSRWGKEESEYTATTMPSQQMVAPVQTQQPSWQQQQQQPGLVLPGMPSHLDPQQQAELQRLQSRLREINDKMSGLEMEAARVDALPRGHRDRSPSPPPST